MVAWIYGRIKICCSLIIMNNAVDIALTNNFKPKLPLDQTGLNWSYFQQGAVLRMGIRPYSKMRIRI